MSDYDEDDFMSDETGDFTEGFGDGGAGDQATEAASEAATGESYGDGDSDVQSYAAATFDYGFGSPSTPTQGEAAASFDYGFRVPTGPTQGDGAARDLGFSPFSTPASARDMTLQRSSQGTLVRGADGRVGYVGGEDLGTEYANSFFDRMFDRQDAIGPYISGVGDLPPSILGMEGPVRSEVARVAGLGGTERREEDRGFAERVPYLGSLVRGYDVLKDAFAGSYETTAQKIAKGATPIVDATGRVIGAEDPTGIYTTPETNQFFNLDPAVRDAYDRFNAAQEAERLRYGDGGDGGDGGSDMQPLLVPDETEDEDGEPTAFPEFTPREYAYQPFTAKFYTIPSRFTQPYGLLG